MKTALKVLSLFLALTLVVGTGITQAAAETDISSLPGSFSLIAVKYLDEIKRSEDLNVESTLVLSANGTGSLDMDGDRADIAAWSLDTETITATLTDGSIFTGNMLGSFLAMDFFGGGYYIFYYAREGADRADAMDDLQAAIAGDVPSSRLYAFWSNLSPEKGIHLNYELHTDYLDSTQYFDVHGKQDTFYSERTTKVSGYTDTVVTFFRGGTAYTLYPDKLSGSIATTTSVVFKDILMMDSLYSDIAKYAREKTFTEEKRDFGGSACVAEVFPKTDYTPEIAFYFNDEDRLIACVSAPPVVESAAKIGESVYTIHAIDDKIDESRFDISAYTIS